MQNIVDVACSSPPVMMNATKPAAQAVQAADQDPFGMVLQKASNRVDNKQSEDASKRSELKSTEKTSGSDSSSNNRVNESKNEREVVRSNKVEKTEKPEKPEKDEKAQDNNQTPENELATDPSTMIYGYVVPVTSEVDNATPVDMENVGAMGDAVVQAVQPANLSEIASTMTVKAEEGVSEPVIASAQPDVVSEPTETQDSKVESDPAKSFDETVKRDVVGDAKTATDLKQTTSNTNEKVVEDGQVVVSESPNTTNHGQDVNLIARKSQEVVASSDVSGLKIEKPVVVDTTQESAPPDKPDGTAGITATATVQNASQVNEPARLAEAPKNEVINQVANQIDQMVKTNRSSLRMQLYPEELGHIDLRIFTTKDGIGITMVTDKASTQQVLKSEMDLLKQNIEQAGIQLTNLNINQGQNSNGHQSFEHRQNFSNKSYSGASSDSSGSTLKETKLQLVASVVDYKA